MKRKEREDDDRPKQRVRDEREEAQEPKRRKQISRGGVNRGRYAKPSIGFQGRCILNPEGTPLGQHPSRRNSSN